MTRHSQRPQRDNTDLDKFFAEADDIIEHWNGGIDAGTWAADGSHQPAEIEGDYYASDYPAGVPDDEIDDEAADYMAMREAERRRTNPRNGGGLFQPTHPVSNPDPENYPPSYVPTVARMWLVDIWFAGWLGAIRAEQADNVRNGFPTVTQSLRDLDALLVYVTGYTHEELVRLVDRLWTEAMMRVQEYGTNARAVLFPSGNLYYPGDPAPWPDWEECLLPVPPDRGEEYVRQVYLHSWLMLHWQLPVPVPVVGALEGLVRQTIEAQFSGMRLVAGLHGSRFEYRRDEREMCTRFSLRTPARNADDHLVWLTADATISDQVAYEARTITQYGLPHMQQDHAAMVEAFRLAGIHPDWLVQGSWTTQVPPSAGTHDPHAMSDMGAQQAAEQLRTEDTSGRETFEYELLSPTPSELRERIQQMLGTALNDAEAGEEVTVELNNPPTGGTDE